MNKQIELTEKEFETLKSVLKFFIYQSVPLYKGSLDQVKDCESILFKKMKVKEWCLIRSAYIEH
jgi:hypothetical protein